MTRIIQIAIALFVVHTINAHANVVTMLNNVSHTIEMHTQ